MENRGVHDLEAVLSERIGEFDLVLKRVGLWLINSKVQKVPGKVQAHGILWGEDDLKEKVSI